MISLMESKYLRFSVIGLKPKTKVYGVFVKDKTIIESGVTPQPILLGRIKYHGPWRQYCYFPVTDETVIHYGRVMYTRLVFLFTYLILNDNILGL